LLIKIRRCISSESRAEFFWDGTLGRRNVTEIQRSVYNYFVLKAAKMAGKSLPLRRLIPSVKVECGQLRQTS
jgi:hypothetical protein